MRCFLSSTADVPRVAAAAAVRQQYFNLNLRNLKPESKTLITPETIFYFLWKWDNANIHKCLF